MLTRDEILTLASDLESDRVERKRSARMVEILQKNVCAFANDIGNHQQPGYAPMQASAILMIGCSETCSLALRAVYSTMRCHVVNKVLLPVYIIAGFIFITAGILSDTWTMRILWFVIGLGCLLYNVLALQKCSDGTKHD